MELSLKDSDFLGSFELLWSEYLDKYKKNKLNLFILKINSNEFDYDLLINMLIDPVIDYSISRQVKKKYNNRPATLSKKAREKFIEYAINNGELGELLLFCFLETHLGAPKILTKLELKTSTSHYVNGADGVHFFKLPDGNYQLIFGESKTYKEIYKAIYKAFKSINDFKNGSHKNGKVKSGIQYEKSLISDNLIKETFSKEEMHFIESLIYPSKTTTFNVDDAFGIFMGFQIDVTDDEKALPAADFRAMIRTRVDKSVRDCFEYIQKKIVDYKLQGHNFYIYVLPFTDIDSKRKNIMEAITK